jgi:TolA-binding protein
MSDDPLREFLDAEKSRPDPSLEVQQRTMSRLSATLGLGAGLDPGSASSPPADPLPSPLPSAPTTGGSLSRVLGHAMYRTMATFLVGAAVGATVYGTVARLRPDPRPPSPAQDKAIVAPPSATPAPAAFAPNSPTTVENTPGRVASAPNTLHPSGEPVAQTRDTGLAAERNLIEIARTALARSHIDGALATLRRHARQYPKGQLSEERDSLLVQALVAKGDYAQARERATRFRRQHPNSLFLPAVVQAVQSIP